MKAYKKVLALMLCAIWLLSSAVVTGAEEAKQALTSVKADFTVELASYTAPIGDDLLGHKLTAENEGFELYVKKETLSIIIRDKKTGAYMASTVDNPTAGDNAAWKGMYQSGVAMEYIKNQNQNNSRIDMINGNPKLEYSPQNDGFVAKVSYPEFELGFTLIVKLTDTGFTAEIPKESIVETGTTYKVARFYIYPFLGYSEVGLHEGYMYIPDGQGALIYLEDNESKYSSPYRGYIYGQDIALTDTGSPTMYGRFPMTNDTENAIIPCFGMVHTDSKIGFLGIIESGDFFASIEAYPNGAITRYDWISAVFEYRRVYNQPTSQSGGSILTVQQNQNNFDAKVRYEFVTGDDADYVGLASRYREYLQNNGTLTPDTSDFNVEVDFLGADKKNWAISKLMVNMTTFEQAQAILSELQESGVTDIMSVYKGWQKDGIYGGLPVEGFDPASSLGGKSGLKSLLSYADKNGISLHLNHDALHLNPDEDFFETFNIVRRYVNRDYNVNLFGWVYSTLNYLTPERSQEIFTKAMRSYSKNGIERLSLCATTNKLFGYRVNSTYYDRSHTFEVFDNITSQAAENMELVLEQPFAYQWKYASALTDMPVAGSNYIFTDEEIPFLSIVLKGSLPYYAEYVNFQANEREFFLRLVEQGAYPAFYVTYQDPSELQNTNSAHIYSSRFSLYKDQIVSYYNELKAINEKISGAYIIGHEKNGQIVTVTYDNGVKIVLDYKKLSYEVVNSNE